MIWLIVLLAVSIVAWKLMNKPEANLNNKLWAQVFEDVDRATKIEWQNERR